MSIFDQFNANPYIRTYAGAPINEAMQVAGALQKRAETNIANMDKMMLMADGMKTMGQADAAYKQQYMADLNRQIEEISKAPEHGTAKVRRLATKTAMDPGLKAIQATAAASAKWQEEYAKDPTKYGDVAAWEFQQAQKAYEDAGGAAGGAVFRAPALAELMDVNKFFLDNGSKIAASQEGVAFEDGKFIHEKTREQLSPERVHSILKGAASQNPQLMKQMQRQLNMENSMRMDGTSMDLNTYLDNQVNPYSGMFAFSKGTHKMKALPKGDGGSGMGGFGSFTTTKGADVKFDMSGGEPPNANAWIERFNTLSNSGDRLEQQSAMNMRAAWNRAVDAYAAKEGLDPIEVEILKSGNTDLLPKTVQEYAGTSIKEGAPIYKDKIDSENLVNYLTERNYSPEQAMKISRRLNQALGNNTFTADIMDNYTNASTMVMDTKYQQTAATLGLTAREEEQMNDMLQINLNSMDVLRVGNEDQVLEEMTSEDFKDEYDINSARIVAHDINGTGAMQLAIKDEDGVEQMLTIQTDPSNNNLYRTIGNRYARIANDANVPQSTRIEAARAAMNVVYPQIAESAEMAKARPGQAVPLMFGDLNNIITQKFGTVTMNFNADGDLEVLNNGTNLFENSPEFSNLAEQTSSPQQMATLVLQYLQQNL